MRIQSNSPSSGYPLVAPAMLRPGVARGNDAGTPLPSRSPLTAYGVPPPVDVLQGLSARAQRAIAAYTQNDVFEQRAQYTRLLGIDIYA